MDAGPRRLSARPTSLVVEAPIVKPTLMPETVKGYFLPRYSRTPSPPPTPTMNPPLVKTTATCPVSARLGVAGPTDARNPNTAASTNPVRYFFITFPFQFQARATMAQAPGCKPACCAIDQ